MSNKKVIRQNQIEIRNAIDPSVRALKNIEIAKKLESLDLIKDAQHVLFYYTNGSEVDTLPLIEKWSKKKTIYLPKIIGKNEFYALPFTNFSELQKGPYAIPEPMGEAEGKMEDKLDLIILPGVASDTFGTRLGMGKGFYDRYLSHLHKGPKIALAYSAQMLDQLPKDPYDEPTDIIITDKEIYNCNS